MKKQCLLRIFSMFHFAPEQREARGLEKVSQRFCSGGADGGEGVLFLRAPSVKQNFGAPSSYNKQIFLRKIAEILHSGASKFKVFFNPGEYTG